MAFIKKKDAWIVPALAVSLIAGVSVGRYFATPTEPQGVDFAASGAAVDGLPTEGQKGIAMHEAVHNGPAPAEVTRTTSLDLLETASAAALGCVAALQDKVAQIRVFYAPRAINVAPSEMDAVKDLVAATMRCDGAQLQLIGQHSDQPGSGETIATGKLRVLAMVSSLVSAGYDPQKIVTTASDRSVGIQGQPDLPNSRVDFQIISN